jgi:signal transduction histidine kinase
MAGEARPATPGDLLAADAVLTTLIEALNVGILLQDEHRRVVLTNAAFVELFAIGLTPDKLRGADMGPRFAEAARRGRPFVGEEIVLPGGRVVERDYMPVTLHGTTLGHLWVFRDVTAQAEIRRTLEDRNHLLTEISELKTEFVRVASHELRTPLTSIATFASMLELDSIDERDRVAAAGAIRRNAERMQVLVADLLFLAQLESAEPALSLRPLDVAALVRDACAGVPGVAADIAAGPPYEGDEQLLRQLFATVVGVVAAAADPGAAVTVRASPTDASPTDGWDVTVSTDTAEPATVERLLSTRLPHPEAEGEQRTGALALMLAREIAARHGGTLTTSVSPTGLTVSLHLIRT